MRHERREKEREEIHVNVCAGIRGTVAEGEGLIHGGGNADGEIGPLDDFVLGLFG